MCKKKQNYPSTRSAYWLDLISHRLKLRAGRYNNFSLYLLRKAISADGCVFNRPKLLSLKNVDEDMDASDKLLIFRECSKSPSYGWFPKTHLPTTFSFDIFCEPHQTYENSLNSCFAYHLPLDIMWVHHQSAQFVISLFWYAFIYRYLWKCNVFESFFH